MVKMHPRGFRRGKAINFGPLCSFDCYARREAISINQGHFRAYKLLGSALYALGDLAAAEHALQQSLAINPSYADASCDLGVFLLCSPQAGVDSVLCQAARVMFQQICIPMPGHAQVSLSSSP